MKFEKVKVREIGLVPTYRDYYDASDVDAYVAKVEKLKEAAEEFVAKVERGEARSTRSYSAFKQALAALEATRR